MASFGKRLAELRKEKELSQTDLANQLETSVSVISRYERDEMNPSIDAAMKLAGLLGTTVGYLLGESDDHDLFKDPEMLKRFKDLKNIGAKEREHILFAIDSMLKNIKLKSL
jgi:transcriptional regulator with XRE-family HTH domain